MELILAVLLPFPLGWFVRNQLVAYVAYIAAHAFVFTFQTLTLVLEWAGGDEAAFGPFPDASMGSVTGYAVVNLVIYAAGLGLVHLGHRLSARRRAKATGAVHLDPVAS